MANLTDEARPCDHAVADRVESYPLTPVRELDLKLSDGRTLHVYDAAERARDGLAVVWHHGTPNVGEPPEPLFAAAARLGIRWLSYDRPGYGLSSPRSGRDVASAAADVASISDALDIERFAVMGHSGRGPHALACAALLPDHVIAAVSVSGLAPFDAQGLDWFAGMSPAGAAELRAAVAGRAALEERLASSGFDPEQFTPADQAALEGEWSWLARIAGRAIRGGLGGMVDDDVAYVSPWGFDVGQIHAPVLLVQGGQDRIAPHAHAGWLTRHIRSAELWLRPDDGHISVLGSGPKALEWLRETARQS
jgi:pimeloyl-ACP methyl ester carboxylesterase